MTTTIPELTLEKEFQDVRVVKPGDHFYKSSGRPNNSKYLIDGEPYKRVTSILEIIDKPGLRFWYRDQALERVRRGFQDLSEVDDWDIDQMIAIARDEPDRVRDEAADWGTRAHKLLQAYIQGYPTKSYPEELQPTLEAFKQFEQDLGITWVATEQPLWDSELRIAGTVDALGWFSRPCPNCSARGVAHDIAGWVIEDHKTGKSLYPEHAAQIGAYAHMAEELYGIVISEAYVVRLPRDQPASGPVFEAKQVADLVGAWEQYVAMAELGKWQTSHLWV